MSGTELRIHKIKTCYTIDELIGWLKTFHPIGEKGGWSLTLPSEGMPENIIDLLEQYMKAS